MSVHSAPNSVCACRESRPDIQPFTTPHNTTPRHPPPPKRTSPTAGWCSGCCPHPQCISYTLAPGTVFPMNCPQIPLQHKTNTHAHLRACPAASPHQCPLGPQLCLCLQIVAPIRPQERLVSSHKHGACRTSEPVQGGGNEIHKGGYTHRLCGFPGCSAAEAGAGCRAARQKGSASTQRAILPQLPAATPYLGPCRTAATTKYTDCLAVDTTKQPRAFAIRSCSPSTILLHQSGQVFSCPSDQGMSKA